MLKTLKEDGVMDPEGRVRPWGEHELEDIRSALHFEGEQGAWHKVRRAVYCLRDPFMNDPNDPGNSRFPQRCRLCGGGYTISFYEGAKGAERFVLDVDEGSGLMKYYQGEAGAEYIVRSVSTAWTHVGSTIKPEDWLPDPSRLLQPGEKRSRSGLYKMRMSSRAVDGRSAWQRCRQSGEVWHHAHQHGRKITRVELPSGEESYHEASVFGLGRLVRSEWPSGRVEHFEGEAGEERLVRVEVGREQQAKRREAVLRAIAKSARGLGLRRPRSKRTD